MKRYIAFLRGINVGGHSLIRMIDLKAALEAAGFSDVMTYIQSGNVLFSSDSPDTILHAQHLQQVIANAFSMQVRVVVFTGDDWRHVVDSAPTWWGSNKDWKHNVLILLPPLIAQEAIVAIGEAKPGIEQMAVGNGVVYQSIELAAFGRSTGGKLAANPIYKAMTVRNHNTARKLADFL